MNTEQNEKKIKRIKEVKRKTKGVCVKLSPEDYERISNESTDLGRSIPSLLREKYFKGEIKCPLFYPKESEKIYLELKYMGNNINQVARALNSGFREGFNGEIEILINEFKRVSRLLGVQIGSH